MAKPPVVGTVAYISKRGTEIHLQNDSRRYRGIKLRPEADVRARFPGSTTYPIFRINGIAVGDVVCLYWGGFANLNIKSVVLVETPTSGVVRPVTYRTV